jgi:histidinol-phosphate phosphatase family protein
MNLKDLCFTEEWTLFLDRDGVISRRMADDYVKRWEDFRFIDGVLEALASFNRVFGWIIIVSNQQGVGKGLMSAENLKMIDSRMKQRIAEAGGRIDASYYSPYLASENHPDRKPGTGMALKAKTDFPGIDFSKSLMVGDSISDMEFGKKLGMITVMISAGEEKTEDSGLVDYYFPSLLDFSLQLKLKNDQRPMTSDQ